MPEEKKTLGVQLTTMYGGNPIYYECSIVDNVCPDNFVNSDGTGANICSSNNIIDEDCLPRVEMRCGNVTLTRPDFTSFTASSCQVPTPQPTKNCPNANDCVYANEITGANATCYPQTTDPFNTPINNKDGTPITCSNNNAWCPKGFQYILLDNKCRKISSTYCNDPYPLTYPCDNLFNATYDPCNDQALSEYTKNIYCNHRDVQISKCLIKNATSQKYQFYCGTDYLFQGYTYYKQTGISVK